MASPHADESKRAKVRWALLRLFRRFLSVIESTDRYTSATTGSILNVFRKSGHTRYLGVSCQSPRVSAGFLGSSGGLLGSPGGSWGLLGSPGYRGGLLGLLGLLGSPLGIPGGPWFQGCLQRQWLLERTTFVDRVRRARIVPQGSVLPRGI